jgi:glutathione S-transferase
MVHAYPERWVGDGDEAAARAIRDQAQRKVSAQLDLLEAHMQSHGQAHLLGERFSAVDPFAFMLCVWTRRFDPALGPAAHARPVLGAYLQRMLQRPCVQRVLADERHAAPG